MTISKQKAKRKAAQLLEKVQEEVRILASEGYAYTHINAVPNGRRLVRLCKRANIKLRTAYLFDTLRFVHFL
jgi:plasmid stabilization system protein ParE